MQAAYSVAASSSGTLLCADNRTSQGTGYRQLADLGAQHRTVRKTSRLATKQEQALHCTPPRSSGWWKVGCADYALDSPTIEQPASDTDIVLKGACEHLPATDHLEHVAPGPSSDIFGSQGLEETMEPSPDLALSGFSPDTFFALPPPDY